MKKWQWNDSDIAVVRKVADEMRASEGETYVPCWDPELYNEHQQDIRDAARAVLGTLDPEEGTDVPIRAMGALLRYVVDILEP